MQWIKQHVFVFISVIVVLAALSWYLLSSSSPAPILTTSSSSSGSPSAESSDQQLVSTLLALRAVSLSGTIFQDPAFTSLADFSTSIVPEPVGRTDPFAPLPHATSTQDNPHAAQLFTPAR
jgi:hypothetical protein